MLNINLHKAIKIGSALVAFTDHSSRRSRCTELSRETECQLLLLERMEVKWKERRLPKGNKS